MPTKSGDVKDMDQHIRNMLQRVQMHPDAYRIVDYIGDDQARFDALIRNFIAGPYRITQRASWPLTKCVERFPSLAKSHLPTFIKALASDGHPAVRRNMLRSLQYIKIPPRYYSRLVKLCESILRGSEPIAIQVFAMEVWAQIAEALPELQIELCTILEERLPYGSAGYRNRAMKILKRFKRKAQPY